MAYGRQVVFALALVLGTVALTAAMPGLSLEQERKAAIAEGLSVVTDVVPSAHRDLLKRATSIFARTSVADYRPSGFAIAGMATAPDRAKVAALAKRLGPTFAALRAAASAAPFATGVAGWWEIQQAEYALKHLTAAAALGIAPRTDLIAVARLSGLLYAVPDPMAQRGGLQRGEDCLTVARRLKMGKAVAQALGAAPPVRSLLRPLLPRLLDGVRQRETFLGWTDWKTRLTHRHPNAEAEAIAGWRRIWRRLPADAWDYEGAAKLLDAELPRLEALGVADFGCTCSACPIRYGPSDASATLRHFARLEAVRKALR